MTHSAFNALSKYQDISPDELESVVGGMQVASGVGGGGSWHTYLQYEKKNGQWGYYIEHEFY